jgi:ketosteroid isomerase-like protein
MQAVPQEHPHVAAYRRMIAAFNQNDLSAVAELMAEDVVYTIPGRSIVACSTRGLAEHLAALKRAREASGGTLRLEPETILCEGDVLLIWGRVSAERQGRKLATEHCVMYRFADGKIVEGRTVPIDQYAFDEFWGRD